MTDTETFILASGAKKVTTRSRASDRDSTGTVEAEEIHYKSNFPNGTRPKFEKVPPGKMKLIEGGSIRLDCVITGNPDPLVTWSRNGLMLKSGYRFKVVEDKERSKL